MKHMRELSAVAAVGLLALGAFGREDMSVPVRPGDPEKGRPFWNEYATIFHYAPAFDFKTVDGAVSYRFVVTNEKAGARETFEADRPWAPLSPVWNALTNTTGYAVSCEGLGADGRVIGSAGSRAFTKAAGFNDLDERLYEGPARPYRESAVRIFDYMTSLKAMRTLVETGRPEQTYQHNAYVSKTHAAHVQAMLAAAKRLPERREEALRFAKASAEFLLAELEPADAPLAWWPPTYGRKPLECDPNAPGKAAMVGNDPAAAAKFRGEVMLLYPASAALAFLDYHKESGDARFLRAARGIAETFLKVRRPDGTWPLKMELATGRPTCPNVLVPTRLVGLFGRLFVLEGDARWKDAADAAFRWLEENPVVTMNWDAQFEDVEPQPPYQRLTKHNAVETLFLLLERRPGDPEALRTCRDLLRFCEDQFVFWEAPAAKDERVLAPGGEARRHPPDFRPGGYDFPSVFEQYGCYDAIDASADKMIRAYLAMWRAERNPLDLAKARMLANSITRVQLESGRVPTFWTHNWLDDPAYDWLNCMEATLMALLELDAETAADPAGLAEFRDARFGLFVHWGLYAQLGGRWKGQAMDYIGEWIQSRFRIPNGEYSKLAAEFNPVGFDAEEWARTAKAAGMEYVTFTAKHHEGFSMFGTKASEFNIVDATPFGRDVFRELADACRRHGLKVCFYYSQCLDWHEFDAADPVKMRGGNFGMDWGNSWDWPEASEKDFSRYLKRKVYPQVKELLTRYGKIAAIWFDCPFGMTMDEAVGLREYVRRLSPGTIVNSRLGFGLGDYGSLGDNQDVSDFSSFPLESPMTLNDTWGYKRDDRNWKTASDVARTLVRTVSCDANLLLNVGPDERGRFPEGAQKVLEKLADWRKKTRIELRGAGRSPFPQELPWGWCLVARDGTLQLVVREEWTKPLEIAGLRGTVQSCSAPWKWNGEVLRIELPERLSGMPDVIRLTMEPGYRVDRTPAPQNGELILKPRLGTLRRGAAEGGESVQGAAGEDFGGRRAEVTPRGTLKCWHHAGDGIVWRVRFPAPGSYRAALRTESSAHSAPWKDGRRVALTVGRSRLEATLGKDRDVEHTVYDRADSVLGEVVVDRAGVCEIVLETLEGTKDSNPIELLSLSLTVSGRGEADHPSLATRVMCLGDSITHFGYCEYYLQLFENLRHPGSAVRYVNAGYSGGTVGTGLNRLPLETDRIRPDRAFVMFGMNDVRWTDYVTNAVMSAERRQAADKALTTYRADLPKLVDRILASGVRDLTLVTPTPYDEYSTVLGPRRKFVNEYGLSLAAESVRRLAAEKGLKVVDLHAALTDACRANPGKKLCGGDSVHPGKTGHLLMASVYWRTLGYDRPVAAVTLDASGTVIRVENAEVSDVSATASALAFDYTPGALPFPDCPEYGDVKAINPDFARFNREPLVVVGLKAGDWELLVDGRKLGTFSSEILSRGVNLAELDTPNRRQAAKAMEAAYRLHDFDVPRRDVACVRGSFEKFGVDMNDRDALAKRSEERLAKLKAEKYPWYDWEKAASEKFLASVGREAEIAAEENWLYESIAAPRPVTCRVEIRRKDAASLGLAKGETVSSELSVMTWNTEHYGWWNRSAAECALIESNMFAVVRAVNPDVLLVVETYGSFERFRKALPDCDARQFGSCNSVFSRHPIVATYDTYRERTLYGCTNGWDYAGETGPFHFAVAELDVGGRRVRVCPLAMNWQPYATSLPDGLDAAGLLAAEAGPQRNGGTPRPQAIKDILASVRDLLDETDRIPLVIGGDFNSHSHLDWTERTAHHFGHNGRVVAWPVSQTMAAAGFVDTYRLLHPDPVSNYGTTFMRSQPGDPKSTCYARIDFIYSKGAALRPIRSEAFNGSYHQPFEFKGERYTCFPSDHGFLVTTFNLQQQTVKLSANGESTLTAYLPKGTDIAAAVVICPGGGYRELCDTYEGDDMARWLVDRGIAAFVLRYRLAPKHSGADMLADIRNALRCVRDRSAEWRIDPRRVGVLGFSAGGHLACLAGTMDWPCRPDFMALVYPHISMTKGLGHEHMRKKFLGPDATEEDARRASGELLVSERTPPTFLVHARTDEVCPVEHSRRFAAAMREKGRPVEYLELESGRHGLGCGKGTLWTTWLSAFGKWLDGLMSQKDEV